MNPETLNRIAADVAAAIASIDWDALERVIAAWTTKKRKPAKTTRPRVVALVPRSTPAELASDTQHHHSDLIGATA